MVKVSIKVEGESEDTLMYIDDKLNSQIDKNIIPKIHKKDMDRVYIIDGEEGSGKSVFAQQLGKKFDPNLKLDNICFTPDEFTKRIINAKKGECIIFDEAFTGFSSRGALTEINKLLVGLMMEMRQKNLFVLIVMPSFFLLDKYVAIWRAKGLFHVFTKHGKRGYWRYFNNQEKKILYLKGKNVYDYSFPKSRMKGVFFNKYTINEEDYRKKKKEAIGQKSRSTRAQVFIQQRDTLFYIMNKQLGQNNTEISRMCKDFGFKIDRTSISKIITEKHKDFISESEL